MGKALNGFAPKTLLRAVESRKKERMKFTLTLFIVVASLMASLGPLRAAPFYQGGDISMLSQVEKEGVVFKDAGKAGDLIQLMRRHGCNTFRVRLFVNPNGQGGTIQDLPYVLALGKRIKTAGGLLLLDLHYSDTWADPKNQQTPAAWEKLALAPLEKQVENYTREVLAQCRAAGCAPDVVQIGNEIQSGILKPLGGYQQDTAWKQYGQLLRAGVRGAKASGVAAKIMIHAENGGKAAAIANFCQRLKDCQVEYDLLGLSFYCEWQGTPANLAKTLAAAAPFGKPVVVVEVAYPWRGDKAREPKAENYPYPFTPEGQRDFLKEVVRIVRAAPNGLGQGVVWWFPESVKIPNQHTWKGGSCALFDDHGEALPAWSAFERAQ